MGRRKLQTGVLATVVAVVAACGSSGLGAPSQAAWTDRVPTRAPAALVGQPVVTRGPDSITLLPISPTGARIGASYGYDMPHCGLGSPIDVDGSFWDAAGVPETSVAFDGQPGTFRLDSPNRATFTTTDGQVLKLVRHSGAKEFRICS